MEEKEVITLEKVETELSTKAKVAKIFAIIIFALIMTALAGALISDIILFGQQILYFIFACLASAVVFIIAIVLMMFSIVFIFGIYILENEGFWPAAWTENAFKDIMADAAIQNEQIAILIIIRFVLVFICLIVFILSIVALVMAKKAKKEGYVRKQGLTTAFSVVSLIMSIFGFFAAGVLILILSLF